MSLWLRMWTPTPGSFVRLTVNQLPLKVTAVVNDVTPYNHHYHFDQSTNSQPAVNLGRWNLTSSNATGQWVETNYTVAFNYNEPGIFNEACVELAGDMALYLVSLTLQQLPPAG